MTPAEEVRAAAAKIRESGKPIAFPELDATNIRSLIADWLTDVGDEMDDEHAHVIDHPEWIGLDESLRWGVHPHYDHTVNDRAPWKTALITARAINGEPEASATQPMPAAEVLTGEVTSPYGPCSATEDPRDNTCTNFAAEYVAFDSAIAGLTADGVFSPATTLRRMCTPCADATPNVTSRRPLTTAPGGYPVAKATVAATYEPKRRVRMGDACGPEHTYRDACEYAGEVR